MTNNQPKNQNSGTIAGLWLASLFLAIGLLFARTMYSEYLWATVTTSVLLVVVLGALVHQNRTALKGRAAAHGLNSIVTAILVFGIVGVLNFLADRYPQQVDLTKNKLHTLSDQTEKVIRGLQKSAKVVLFSKPAQREEQRPLLENLQRLNPKFEIEYVDPDKEPARAKQLGIKKYGTLHLAYGARDQKIEDPNEEKITNALIKLVKDKAPRICAITGHGEKSFSSQEADGYDAAKKAMAAQSYEVEEINLPQQTKIPDGCDTLAIIGPIKSFFAPEVKAIEEYLGNGGRAIITVDADLKGTEPSPELSTILEQWYVKPQRALIVDPLSRMLGVDASVPILPSFAKDHPITREFQSNCYFPFARPLEIVAGAPVGTTIQWIAQTSPKAWAETNFATIGKGEVRFDAGADKAGPLTTAVAIDGKLRDSKAARNSRLVVFGSSNFATNNYSRFGGNLDFFMNAVSWVLEDESLISIRAKEEGPGKVELSGKQQIFIAIFTVVLIPLLTAVAGIAIWVFRKRL